MSDQSKAIEVPEGMDTGIYTQGYNAKAAGAPDENPFSPDFPHQFESWAAGYAAGTAPEPAPDAETQAPAPSSRKKSSSEFE